MKFDLEKLKYDSQGLIAAIIQDYLTNEVLMLGYMNEEALEKTLITKKATFWSRSRQKFWVKGETSGNVQEVKEIYYDCDQDAILLKVNQIGGAACHEGYKTCFFRKIIDDQRNIEIIGERLFNPDEVYKTK